jgi:hypothetical protein
MALAALAELRHWIATTALGASFGACAIPKVDLENKACPCVEGFVCIGNKCVPPEADFLPEQCILAKDGQIAPPMKVYPDTTAPGGQYVATDQINVGSVSFTFTIHEPGLYVLQTLLMTPEVGTNGHNSFFVGLDDERAQGDETYTFSTEESATYTWQDVNRASVDTYPMTWNLSPGQHRFTIYGREPDTRCAEIVLRKCPAEGCGSVSPSSC